MRPVRYSAVRRRLAIATVGLFGLLSVSPIPVRAQEPPAPSQNVLAGSRVFGDKGCGTCHAINGLGGTLGPDLAQSATPKSVPAFAAAMWNHLPGMSAQMRAMDLEPPRLRARETGNLIAFLFWVNYFNPSGDAEVGQRLFGEKGCIVCHQVAGVGGVIGPSLDFTGESASAIHVAAALWNHGPEMTDSMEARGLRRPTFLAAELNDLLAYLGSVTTGLPAGPVYVLPGRADAGEQLFEEKSCIACHSIRGHGGRRAPDLAQRPRRDLLDFAATLWNKSPDMARVMRDAAIDVPQLTPSDMANLVAYLASVQYLGDEGSATRGREHIAGKGCLGCHSLAGRGGTNAPDLARVSGLDSQTAVIAAMWSHVVLPELGDRRGWNTLNAQEISDLIAFFMRSGGR